MESLWLQCGDSIICFGVMMDAVFKISSRTDMGADEIRKTLESVPQTFIREFGVDAYKHVTGQI